MDYITEKNRIYKKDESGTIIAEITFPEMEENLVNINHTYVDDSLRGQGIASTLMQMAYTVIKEKGYKAKATCSYAKIWFDKHPECADILTH